VLVEFTEARNKALHNGRIDDEIHMRQRRYMVSERRTSLLDAVIEARRSF